MSNSVFFSPWTGKNYYNGGVFGKKILVLGESHYCRSGCEGCGSEECAACHTFTTDIISEYLDPSKARKDWMRTFVKFERSLVNHITDWEERRKIWDSVAFYNYLQVPMDDARQAGTEQQYRDAEGPFFQVLNKLRPEFLIIWGYRLWNMLPSHNWHDTEEIKINYYKVLHGEYELEDGTPVKVVCVYHPAAGYSWDYWYKVINSVK